MSLKRAKIEDNDVLSKIHKLRLLEEKHLSYGKMLFTAYNGTIYALDLLAVASLNRSLNLLSAFCKLVEEKNIIAAAPLLRLQLDNTLRFSASYIVKDPHEFSKQVLDGHQINKLKDEKGNRMTDSYLVSLLSKEDPWIERVYKNTSGYVHLSEKHIFNTINAKEDLDKNTLEFRVAIGAHETPDDRFSEVIEAFEATTELFFKYLYGWIFTKENPSFVAEIKNKFIEETGSAPEPFSSINKYLNID